MPAIHNTALESGARSESQHAAPSRRSIECLRPHIPGWIALADGGWIRDPAFPLVDFPQIYPKRWAAVALSGGPTESEPIAFDGAADITGVDIGDAIVALAAWTSATITLTSITCSGESDLTLLTARGPSSPDNTRSHIGYLAETTGSGTKTVTFNMSGGVGGSGIGFVIALAGHDAADFFEAENYATGSSANGSVTVTTATNNCFLAGIHVNNGGDPSGVTNGTHVPLANQHWNMSGMYWLDSGTAGGKVVQWTHASGAWIANGAAFNAAGSAPIVVEIGLVTETDTAQPITANKTLAIGFPSETDSAQAMTVNGSSVFLDVAHARELRDHTNTVWASVADWEYAWYDSFDALFGPSSPGAPAGSGTFSTDANGAARIEVPGTTLAAGQSGALVVKHPTDATVFAILNVPIGP